MACKHPNKKDLTQGLGPDRHWFCPGCKWHFYRGRNWTRAEWDAAFVDEPAQAGPGKKTEQQLTLFG